MGAGIDTPARSGGRPRRISKLREPGDLTTAIAQLS
jgi:hypothetical protein